MTISILLLTAGFITLFFSGDWLVKASVNLAKHFKVSTLVIGVTVVAFGTSAPELIVSLKAVYSDAADISVGNVVGSNIANIALVLGLVATIYPIKVKRRNVWIDWFIMIIASVGLLLASLNNTISLIEGSIFFGLLILYMVWTIWYSRQQKTKNCCDTESSPQISLPKAIGFFCLAIVGLYFGADWLVTGAKDLALGFGISERVVGLSVVALGTSVPELATSLIAAIKKESDISIGNIIGSNIFNIWAVLGTTSIFKPLNVSQQMISIDYIWMTAISVLLIALMIPLHKGVINRPKGLLLLGIYTAYVYFLFF